VELSVLCGLLSALSYGVADYLSQIAGRAVGVWRTSFYYYLTGVITLSVLILVEPQALHRAHGAPAGAWIAAVASGMTLLAAVVLFTQGLVKGQIAIVAPVTAGYGAVATSLALLMGERFSAQSLLGLTLTVAGASVVALPASRSSSPPSDSGIGWAIAAAIAYGTGFWLQGTFAVPALGPLLPIWVVYASGLTIMGLLQISGSMRLAPPARLALLIPTLSASVFSIVGFVALTIGLGTGRVAVVVVLSSLTSAITVLLARVCNSSSLGWHQWAAIAMIIFGLVLIRL
jgi:drug/metabolite transporter (DMT)-like permease